MDTPAKRRLAISEQMVADSLDRVLAWSAARGYRGYSKFDVFNSPLMTVASLKLPWLRAILTALWARSPINVRPVFRTRISRNPKGIALFALAYLRRHELTGNPADRDEATALLDWLSENPSPGWNRMCWGYDHPWQSAHFYAPRYSPNIVVTGNVIYAFLEAFELLGKRKYLDTARSAVEFLLKDLESPVDEPEVRNIGYVPNNTWAVLNINGLAAVAMARTARQTGERHLFDEARRLIKFLVDKQTDEGAWHYAWPANSSSVKHDNYHTGNILDWILDYTLLTDDSDFLDHYRRGLAFYRQNLFLPSGQPKWRSDRTWPADAHSAAQAVVTFTKAAESVDAACLQDAARTVSWSIENLQADDGRFKYQIGRFWTKSYTLMRWCNAWMAFALSSFLLTQDRMAKRNGVSV